MKPGWYAVAKCWDTVEGVFPSVSHSSASFGYPIIMRSPEPFDSSEEAAVWADNNDPEEHHDAWTPIERNPA